VFDKMLVPLDGSEVAERILPYAIEMAKRCGSKVTLLEMVESLSEAMATIPAADPVMVTPEMTESIVEGVKAEEDSAKQYLARVAQQFKQEGVEAGWVVMAGSPGNEIINYATGAGIDVIAMSSHGRGGLSRAILGSVADHVIHHTTVPVLVVRHQDEKR
jgi:nucleotide-binding universal stress UspA family protein